jgi:hypothetical protein
MTCGSKMYLRTRGSCAFGTILPRHFEGVTTFRGSYDPARLPKDLQDVIALYSLHRGFPCRCPSHQGSRPGSTAINLWEMKRTLYFLADLLGGVVLVLLLLDPTRPLAPIFVLLGLAVAFAIIPRFLAR